IILTLGAAWLPPAAAAETVSLAGRVQEEFQLQGEDGQLYDLAETIKGEDLSRHRGKAVRLQARLTQVDGLPVLTVLTFEVLDP
ncbi:MAG: hypothetical protein AB1634_18660, partial [Thermodesulfobacteriota bacterium]